MLWRNPVYNGRPVAVQAVFIYRTVRFSFNLPALGILILKGVLLLTLLPLSMRANFYSALWNTFFFFKNMYTFFKHFVISAVLYEDSFINNIVFPFVAVYF